METIKEYMVNSQFHGLRFLTEKGRHWLERLFWFCCVLLSWFYSIVLFRDYWVSYITQPLSFVTETDYVHWNTSLFSISVCEDKNDRTVSQLAKQLYGQDFDNQNNMEEVLLEMAHFRGTGAFISKYCYELGRNCPKTGLKELANMARSPCSGMFLDCYWNDEPFDCCTYFLKLETELGICYSINSLQTRNRNPFNTVSNQITGPGTMRLLLLLPSTTFIHAPEDVPFLNSRETEGLVSTADLYKRYSYRILETVNEPGVRDVPIATRQCRYKDENPLWIYKSYSYSACIVQCRLEKQISLCNCSSHLMNFTKTPCDLNGLSCLQDFLPHHLPLGSDGLVCDCVPNCNEPEYDLLDIETFGGIGDHAEIEVALNALPTVKLKRQVVRAALDLVVSIGGSAGLFVGASMLSFVELIYFFCMRALWNRIIKRRKEEEVKRTRDRKIEGNNSNIQLSYENDENQATRVLQGYRREWSTLGYMP